MAYFVQIFFVFVLVILAVTPETRSGMYITPLWFIFLIAVYYKAVKKSGDLSLSRGNTG